MQNNKNAIQDPVLKDSDEEFKRLVEYDRKYLWHPFTQMKDYIQEEPLIITKGEGVYLIDLTGKKYLDGVSSLWVNIHGHRRPEIDQAIIEQLNKIAHTTLLGLANEPAALLAKRLVEITPKGLDRVFYSDTGATAVEIALKIAYQYWFQKEDNDNAANTKDTPRYRRTKFVYLENGYHGDTIGAVSVGGIPLFHEIYKPLLFDSFKAPSPYCYRCSLGLDKDSCNMACVEELGKIVENHRNELVGVILEPLVQGAGGMIVAPEGYLKRAREICTKNNILLIADEVATGFGRTGKMFACEHENVSPDLMAVAKGISGGYLPLAATLASEQIYDAFLAEYQKKRTFYHGHTYTGNPLACAAALANLDIFEKDQTIIKMQEKIKFLNEQLTKFNDLKHVGEVRQKGFLIGIELVKDKRTKEPYPWEQRTGGKVIMTARDRGLVIRPLGDVIVVNPPLCSTIEELGKMVEIIKESIIMITE